MKRPLVGIKTTNIFYDEKDKVNCNVLEITTKDPNLRFNIKKILKAKKHLKGKKLSMHTQTSRIFSCKDFKVPEFNEAELNIVKAEVILCKILGVKELILHLKQEKLTKKEKEIFRSLLKFAKKNSVEIIYESNGNFFADTCLDVLKSFPELDYNLDLGHLNTAIENKTLGMDLERFIEQVKDKIVYIHAHNNYGEDDHNALDHGSLNWKRVLDLIDLNRVRKIIIECHRAISIKRSKKMLEKYLEKKLK